MNAKRILLIENDPKSRYALRSILEDHGHELHVFDSAEAAAVLEAEIIDVAIIDVRLPQQNGVEFAREFRRRNRGSRIVFVTAYDDLKDHPPLEGCTILVKPIEIDSLLKLL